MPEMLLRHPMLTYTEFKQTEDSRYIYRNELDKACFQHDVAYVEKTASFAGSGTESNFIKNMPYKKLVEELQKRIISKVEKWKIHPSFKVFYWQF